MMNFKPLNLKFEVSFTLDGSEPLIYFYNQDTGNIISPEIGDLAAILQLISLYSYSEEITPADLEEAEVRIQDTNTWEDNLFILKHHLNFTPIRDLLGHDLSRYRRFNLSKTARASIYLLAQRISSESETNFNPKELLKFLSDFKPESLKTCAEAFGEDWVLSYLHRVMVAIADEISRKAGASAEVEI